MAIYNTNISGGLNTKDCTADASKILDGYTAGVGKEIVTGTMADNGDVSTAIANGVLKEGYTSGGTIANLEEGNIKDGVTIAGKTGTYESSTYGLFSNVSRGYAKVTADHSPYSYTVSSSIKMLIFVTTSSTTVRILLLDADNPSKYRVFSGDELDTVVCGFLDNTSWVTYSVVSEGYKYYCAGTSKQDYFKLNITISNDFKTLTVHGATSAYGYAMDKAASQTQVIIFY